MFLSIDQVQSLILNGWISNTDTRETTQPEGCGIDLRIESLYSINSNSRVGRIERSTPIIVEVPPAEDGFFLIQPNHYYLAQTVESIEIPNGHLGIYHPRSTLFRSGIITQATTQPPGYKGKITVSLYNPTPYEFFIEKNARFLHLLIAQINGNSSPYRGQWNGGRISTNGKQESQT